MNTNDPQDPVERDSSLLTLASPPLDPLPFESGWQPGTRGFARQLLPRSATLHRLTAIAVVAALLLSAAPTSATAATSSISDRTATKAASPEPSQPGFGKRLLEDLRALISKPAHMDPGDWTNLGLATVAVGATATLDPRVRTWAQDHRSASSDNFAKSIRPLGSWGAFATLGATWLAGEVSSRPSLVSTAEDGLEASIIAAGLVTPVVKEIVGRERPSYGAGHASFSPFSGRASFPSGDATLAFSVASVVAAHASSVWLKGTAWGLAGLVGWERIHLDQHWASDVVAGALVGSAVGEWVVHRHQSGSRMRVGWMIEPALGPGVVGLQLAKSW
jgi:membrane-associated phospholipid phosphatase